MNHTPKSFDEVKLTQMVEPLTVRVEKRKGSQRTPVPLPVNEDGSPPGTNWTKDLIRSIETWLVNEWSGGGYYEITVTDSSQPQAIVMKWEPFFAISDYPERTPPTLADSKVSTPPPTPTPTATQAPTLFPQVTRMNPAFPGGLPPGLPSAAPAAAPQPMAFGGYPPNPYGYAYQQPPFYQRQPEPQPNAAFEAERRAMQDQLAAMQRQLADAQMQQMKQAHEQELKQARAAAEEQIKALQQQMSALRDMIQQQGTQARGPNPELEAMREQQRQTEARLERERAEREAERRDQTLREMMRTQQETMQRQIETMQLQQQQQMAALANNANGSKDQALIMAMQETSRQQMQMMKDISQQQSLQFERMQAFMMRPTDLMQITKEAQSSIDVITDRLARQGDRAFEMQTRVMEQALQMQPQGSGVVDMVRDGITNAKEMAERYFGSKAAQAQAQAQAQMETARLQAEVIAVQAQAQAQAQAQQAHGIPPVAGPNGVTQVSQTSSATPQNLNGLRPPGLSGITTPAAVTGPKRHGRTDVEWFGPLLGEVFQVREGVKTFLESLQMDPPRIDPETGEAKGLSPDEVAGGIQQAAGLVAQNPMVVVNAMKDLYAQKRYADFLDVLLPDVPQGYRDDVVALLSGDKPAQRASTVAEDGNGDEDDDDGGADDGDDGDDAKEEVVETKPAPKTPTKGRAAARA